MLYRRELKIAVESALEAGDMVRSAFHNQHGRSCHESVDAVVEAVIRRRLAVGFPSYGQLGEELHHLDRPAADGSHVWVIDPLDGTESFKRGQRGASVSIALLRDGVPVLGVVFSPVCPDDQGDLIGWAEGEGLTRNGHPVERAPLKRELDGGDTVLLPPGAEKDLCASATDADPARFRFMPSIAYRLALVAVGDADATISWNSPVSWDYAAGHALLRAVGGDLFDVDLQAVAYGVDGFGSCNGVCVGGSRGVARHLTENRKVHSHASRRS